MPAQLPANLITSRPRRLGQTEIGERLYVTFTAMSVDEQGFCYLDPNARVRPRGFNCIRVDRAVDGFHVTVFLTDQTWELGGYEAGDWFEVASITYEIDEEFDMPLSRRIFQLDEKIRLLNDRVERVSEGDAH
jgi:hypothetical protein